MNNETMTAIKSTLLLLVLALLLVGCANTPPAPDSATSHPANPQAAQSPVPPLEPTLLAITNMVMAQLLTEPAPEHHHGHETNSESATPMQHDHH